MEKSYRQHWWCWRLFNLLVIFVLWLYHMWRYIRDQSVHWWRAVLWETQTERTSQSSSAATQYWCWHSTDSPHLTHNTHSQISFMNSRSSTWGTFCLRPLHTSTSPVAFLRKGKMKNSTMLIPCFSLISGNSARLRNGWKYCWTKHLIKDSLELLFRKCFSYMCW